MHISNKKKQKRNRFIIVSIIVIILIASAVGCYLFITSQNIENEIIESNENNNSNTMNKDDEKNTEDNTTVNSEQTYVEDKTPKQYDGQTEQNGNANSIEYNNEQFRIPEDEL